MAACPKSPWPDDFILTFYIVGYPQPAGSKKAVPNPRDPKRPFIVDDNPKAEAWKKVIGMVAKTQRLTHRLPVLPEGVAVVASFTYWVPRPKYHYGTGRNADVLKSDSPAFPVVRPDALKYTRAAEDSLTGIIYHDDGMIVDEHIKKRYVERGLPKCAYASQPGVLIQISVKDEE